MDRLDIVLNTQGDAMSRKGQITIPSCGHPDRPHMARGMCRACYNAEYRQKYVAGPPRPHRSYKRINVTLIGRDVVPERLPEHRNVTTEFPVDDCGKCGGRVMQYHGREARCFTCGHSTWLVREPVPVEVA